MTVRFVINTEKHLFGKTSYGRLKYPQDLGTESNVLKTATESKLANSQSCTEKA